MKRLTPTRPFFTALPCLLAAGLIVAAALCCTQDRAQAAATPTHKEQSGSLPKTGSIALRSGLEWMNESSQLFIELRQVVEPLLTARGLSVAEVPESTLAPLPAGLDGQGAAATGKKQTAKGITLKSYSEATGVNTGKRAAAKTQEVVPPILFFAQTQLEGAPVMLRGGRIPGHVPPEVKSHDTENLDYIIICRMTAVSPGYISQSEPPASGADGATPALAFEPPVFTGNPNDFVTAAGPIQGVGTLGYGSSMPAVPPRSSYGNTPGDYARGYEGNSPVPGDPWHREADMRARDYQLKNSPPAQVATPPAETGRVVGPPDTAPTPSLPKPPLPGDTDMPAVSPGPAPSRPPQSPSTSTKKSSGGTKTLFKGKRPAIAGYALEMECYDLKPAKAGKQPKIVWRCTVQQRADKKTLSAALPGLLRVAFGAQAK